MALTADASTQLGCGRDIDRVWDHLDRAPDAHERTCPYCQAARADLAGLADATRQLRDDDATDPDLQPSQAVLDRILAVARTEVRRGRRLPLDRPSPEGTSLNTVSEQAVTAVVRRVGDSTAHVQVRRCAITTDPSTSSRRGTASVDEGSSADVSSGQLVVAPGSGTRDTGPASVAVSLRVSVAHDMVIAEASQQLRAAVIDVVAREVGLTVTAVDIDVEDVHDA